MWSYLSTLLHSTLRQRARSLHSLTLSSQWYEWRVTPRTSQQWSECRPSGNWSPSPCWCKAAVWLIEFHSTPCKQGRSVRSQSWSWQQQQVTLRRASFQVVASVATHKSSCFDDMHSHLLFDCLRQELLVIVELFVNHWEKFTFEMVVK